MMKRFFLLALVCILPFWGIAQDATVDVPTSNKSAKTVDITTSLAPEAASVQTVAQQNYFKPVTLPKGNTAYAMSQYGGPVLGHVSFDVDDAAGTMASASSLSITPFGGEFYNEVWYCYTNDNTFYKINYQTGEIISQISSTNDWAVDMAYDYSTGTMYGTKSGVLYSINLETGACTTIGTLSETLMTLAVDHSGNMYGINITAGNLYSVDKTTAVCTLIGATGQGCNYVQSMGFDHYTGVLYWCGYGTSGNFFTVDVSTGAATQISAGIGECTSFFVPFVDNPALAAAPTNFTATPQGTDLVCDLAWTNPTTTIGGTALTSISSVVLKRNGVVIQEFTSPTVGGAMTFTDNTIPGAGSYSYSVYAVTSDGNGLSTNASAVIGEMCNIVVEMFDAYGDGWNGGAIQVLQDGNVIGTATLSSGSTGTAEVLVPVATLEFSWSAGSWDSEVTFNIYDAFETLLYAQTSQPTAGVFFTYNNTCESPESAIISGTVTNTDGNAIQGAVVAYDGIWSPTATTNASGEYSLEAMIGETYTITVSKAGYNTITESYTVSANATKNYEMTAPMVSVNPNAVTVVTSYGVNGTATVTLTNDGDGVASYSLAAEYLDKAERDPWDFVNSFAATNGGMQGVVTDGNYIYLCSWQAAPTAGWGFEKYDMDLNFVEGFDITGATQIRDLTYDGTYFYGGSGSTLYCLDLANKTLVSSTSTSVGTIRHCTYDPDQDCFWVGNWSDLYLIDRTGSIILTAGAPQSAYGSGYDNVSEGGPYLLLFCQPSSNAVVYRYNIASNIIESSPVFDFASCPGYDAGISGGAYVGEYNGVVCFFGNMQQSPNLIGIYELGSAGWLSATNPSGEIASGASVDVELVMDGSWAEQGTFHANAIFKINPTQAENPSVYVTFTIGEPVYGSLSGVVTDSQGGLPIAGATVEVAGQTVTTGTNGAYSVENIMVGTYTILVSAANYYDFEGTVAIAEGTNTLDVQLDPINGINDYANVNVYPNPANTEIVVEGNVSSIYVSNSLGQIVEILGNTNSINVTDYKAGIYFLTVNTADGSVMRTKVVVAH